jgi:hypothetical protein
VRVVRGLLRLTFTLFAVVAAVGLYVAYAPVGDAAPHPFNQDRNAVFLEHKWLEKAQGEAEMDQLFRFLDHHGVAYVFPHLIPFDSAGRLPVHDREQMRRFLAAARRAAPEMKVLPWVGGLRVGYRRSKTGTIDFADLSQRQRIIAECRGLMDEGFDGVHVNVEPVANGDDGFLALLRALRSAVGAGTLSLSAIRPGPMALPGAPNFLWSPGYYRRVANEADQVVVMAYDTALPTSILYRRYMAYVARTVNDTLAPSSRARVLVGIPTYDETGMMHRIAVENPENALLGLVAGLRGRIGGGTFEGIALYAGWTTDAEEWATYERLWRGHAAP